MAIVPANVGVQKNGRSASTATAAQENLRLRTRKSNLPKRRNNIAGKRGMASKKYQTRQEDPEHAARALRVSLLRFRLGLIVYWKTTFTVSVYTPWLSGSVDVCAGTCP